MFKVFKNDKQKPLKSIKKLQADYNEMSTQFRWLTARYDVLMTTMCRLADEQENEVAQEALKKLNKIKMKTFEVK